MTTPPQGAPAAPASAPLIPARPAGPDPAAALAPGSATAPPPGAAGPAPAALGSDRDIVAALPLAEKVRLLTGADSWWTHGKPEIGLRPMLTSDGPAGVRGTVRDERHPSASLPCPSAAGATWDAELVQRLATALGTEAKSKGVDILLAPTVNLMRTPLGGRGFEFFAEDPVLTARLATAYVRGVQRAGVAATVKHYVGNDSETDRWTYDAQISETVLRELYLVPFDACVREAGAWLIMAAYNKVNGSRMTENLRLLRGVLKNEWGFDGVVISDWHAARSTHATAVATLDLSMPGPEGPWGDQLTRAVGDGTISEELLNDKVVRLLRLARRVGALGGPAGHPAVSAQRGDAADGAAGPAAPEPQLVDPDLLRTVAAESFVLLHNRKGSTAGPGDGSAGSRGILPLAESALRRVAVVGPNAIHPTIQGGGSAGVTPVSVASPADSLRAALAGRAEVVTALGCQTWHMLPQPPIRTLRDPVTGEEGVRLEFVTGDGVVSGAEHRRSADLVWWDTPDGFGWGQPGRIVLTAIFRAEHSGCYQLGVAGVGALTLSADGVTVIDGVTPVPEDPVEAMTRPGQLRAALWLEAETDTELRLEFRPAADGAGPLTFRLGMVPDAEDETLLAEAVTAAAGADAAIVVVGSAELTESEGFDRTTLSLPGRQDELVRRVAAVNDNTVVVVNSGMPVLMPWAYQVPAIIHAWLPGQSFGDALADVLLGAAEPGGRLPVTLPAAEADCPVLHAASDPGGALRYAEGLLIGYRGYDAAGTRPLYPFGHGLGYTSWDYESLDCPAAVAEGEDLDVVVTIRNTGQRPGKEVVQAYLAEPGQPADRGRPVRALAAFTVIRAAPGEAVVARLMIPARAFARYDEDLASWIWPGGVFTVHVGRSSRDLSLRAPVRWGAGCTSGA
jgi:beta-glucosidase